MDDYWKIRLQFRTDNELLNMKIHRSEETRRDNWLMRPCLPTSVLYIHAKPYLLEHQPIITVGLFRQPSVDGAIGKVVGVQEEKFVEREIGNAQVWIFVEHGVALLWECYFFDSFRSQTRQIGFWKAFEKLLQDQADVREFYTPAWDPAFDSQEYENLLTILSARKLMTPVVALYNWAGTGARPYKVFDKLNG